MGLRLGLLIGIGFALVKTVQSRRAAPSPSPAEPGAWEPLADRAAAPAPAPTAAPADPEPAMAPPPPPTPAPAVTPPTTRPGAGSSPANVRPASPPRPPAESLRMPEVPETPPSAASEGRAATSTPPPVPVAPVDEVGEPIELPAAPPAPTPPRARAPRKSPSTGAAEGTPPEAKLLNAGVDPALDVVPATKAAAKKNKAAAPVKKASPAKKAAKKAAPVPGWVDPADGTCPPTHPVKAKLASRLFHLPGMFAYARTRPDRCYLDADTAVSDGFTAAKR
jgi:hypothetical protein